MSNYFTKASISGILAFVVLVGNQIVPTLSPVWANILGAVLAGVAFYQHSQVVTTARAAGVQGIK